jgi:predicted RecB family nuclease
MKIERDVVRLSATDLSGHLACDHLTTLDYSVARGVLATPNWSNPDALVLQQLGFEHERRYLKHLAELGLGVSDLRETGAGQEAASETLAAMRKGTEVIVQATLSNGRWMGRADVLRRVGTPSSLGPWSYEVYDCKLARETKAATILQLSLYSELVGIVQGVTPVSMYVVSPSEIFTPEPFNVSAYAAYYRLVKTTLEQDIDAGRTELATYPEPNPHCAVCRWCRKCDACWRDDDHLSLVAGISGLQRKQLKSWGIASMAQLAKLPLPLDKRPHYGSKGGYLRVQEQARLQVAGREENRSIYKIFDNEGLARLPEPSPGDIFFDLEGDAFVGTTGMEYLFGLTRLDHSGAPIYECRWSFTAAEEKQAFEWFVDVVMHAWSKHLALHVYHFTAREPSALKRLMGKYATREDAVDRILRDGVLVDLHTALKRSIRASVEEYSLKTLETFHKFTRATPLDEARKALRRVAHGLELGHHELIDDTTRKTIGSYNQDDCLSTSSLRQWLEEERAQTIAHGQEIPRPAARNSEPSIALDDRQQRSAALFAQLMEGVPPDPTLQTDEQSARRLLATLLDWHRREEKAEGQEYYRLLEMPEEELLYERSALFGLEFIGRIQGEEGIPTDRYRFEQQDTNIRAGDQLNAREEKIGEVAAIDLIAKVVEIKKTKKSAEVHPQSVFSRDDRMSATACAESLSRLAKWVISNGVDAPGLYRCARDLLLRRSPRLADRSVGTLVHESELITDAATRIVLSLDSSVLAIQGPPGSPAQR